MSSDDNRHSLKNSRRKFIKGVGASGIAFMAGCSADSSTSGGGDSVELTLSNGLPEGHYQTENGVKVFKEVVEEKSNGEISVELFHGATLGERGAQTQLVKDGSADLTYMVVQYESGVLPLTNVIGIPGLYTDAYRGTEAYNKLVRGPINEHELHGIGLEGIGATAIPAYQLMTTEGVGKLSSLEDFSQLSMRTAGGLSDIAAEKLGASPVQVPGGEMYQALERGTVNSIEMTIAAAPVYDLDEVTSHMTSNINLAGNGTAFFMNQGVFDGLTDDQKQAVREAGTEAALSIGKAHMEESESARGELDVEFYEFPPDVCEDEASPILDEVEAEWLDQVDNGADQEVLDAWKSNLEAATPWEEAQ